MRRHWRPQPAACAQLNRSPGLLAALALPTVGEDFGGVFDPRRTTSSRSGGDG